MRAWGAGGLSPLVPLQPREQVACQPRQSLGCRGVGKKERGWGKRDRRGESVVRDKRAGREIGSVWSQNSARPKDFSDVPSRHLPWLHILFLSPHPPTSVTPLHRRTAAGPWGSGWRRLWSGLPLKLFLCAQLLRLPQTHRLVRQEVAAPSLSCGM